MWDYSLPELIELQEVVEVLNAQEKAIRQDEKEAAERERNRPR